MPLMNTGLQHHRGTYSRCIEEIGVDAGLGVAKENENEVWMGAGSCSVLGIGREEKRTLKT